MPEGFDQLAKGIGKAIETVPELYQDAFQPTVQETGKFVSRIPRAINAAFSGLDKWILNREYSIDETKKLLAQKLENVSPDKIVSPEPYVAVPAIQAISYAMNNEDLRNLYANLLAKSMNIDIKDFVHPSYIEIIKQLSPLDAKVFSEIMSVKSFPVASISVDVYTHDVQTKSSNAIELLEFPIGHYRVDNITYIDFADYESISLSIDNLLRLKLITEAMPADFNTVPDKIKKTKLYKEFRENATARLDNPCHLLNENHQILCSSVFGKSFYKICVI